LEKVTVPLTAGEEIAVDLTPETKIPALWVKTAEGRIRSVTVEFAPVPEITAFPNESLN
jgi:hypothetical protein